MKNTGYAVKRFPPMRRATTGLLEAASRKHMSHAILLTFGEESVFGVPLLIRAILVIPIVTSILSVVFLALTVIAWMRGYWSLVGRLYYSLIALVSVLFVLFAGYWNMLGWRL